MRLLIDADVLCWQREGGISRVFVELLHQFRKLGVDFDIVLPSDCIDRLPKSDRNSVQPFKRLDPGRMRPWSLWSRVAPIWNQRTKSRAMRRSHPDVFLSSFYTGGPDRVPSVAIVYDMIVERHPEWFDEEYAREMAARKRWAVESAHHIVCISEHTKKDVCELLGVPDEKCSTVLLGPGLTVSGKSVQPSRRPFLLFVGSHKSPHKNFEVLHRSFIARMGEEYRGLDLVVVSPHAADTEDCHDGRVSFVKLCTDGELAALYEDCAAFVYPSLYEGFGLPVLEAMKHGAPVACSGTSSLPEVGGDAVDYFDPRSETAMCDAIGKALARGRSAEAIEMRTKHVERFSWTTTAEGILRVCDAVA